MFNVSRFLAGLVSTYQTDGQSNDGSTRHGSFPSFEQLLGLPWGVFRTLDMNSSGRWYTYPSEKWKIWKSNGMIIPNWMENKKCSKPPTKDAVYLANPINFMGV